MIISNNIKKHQSGYIALIAIVIIVAVTLGISLSLNIISIGESQSGLIKQQSVESFGLVDSCLQEAYLRLKRDGAWTGTTLNLGQGSCNITVSSLGSQRTIAVSADVNNVIRQVASGITLNGGAVQVDFWEEQ